MEKELLNTESVFIPYWYKDTPPSVKEIKLDIKNICLHYKYVFIFFYKLYCAQM